jgi:hypothetical protein
VNFEAPESLDAEVRSFLAFSPSGGTGR